MKEIQKYVQKLSREKNLRPAAAAYEPVQKTYLLKVGNNNSGMKENHK